MFIRNDSTSIVVITYKVQYCERPISATQTKVLGYNYVKVVR